MRYQTDGTTITYRLEGRIDANKANEIERAVCAAAEETGATSVTLDIEGVSYLSSAGLRMVTRLLKSYDKVSVVGALPEVYDVFQMTGLTEMMEVSRRQRRMSLDGMRQIGAGAFGRVYRIDDERVVKIYDPKAYPPERIERERRVARQAFIHDIPSAIPFETVRVGEENGIVYELIDARTIGETVSSDPGACEDWARRMAELAIKLHTTEFAEGQLPDARAIFHGWVDRAEASGLHAEATIARLREFVDSIPDACTFVHGDFHPANVMVMPDGELMLIDMADASEGHPVIDLAGAYHVMRVAAKRPGGAMRLCGMPADLLDRFWSAFVRAYYRTEDDAMVAELERNLATVALPRTMGSNARSKLISDEVRVRTAAELERTFLASCDSVRWDLLES